MSHSGADILHKILGDCYAVRRDGTDYAFVLVPYRPFAEFPIGSGGIDAYYFASNALYAQLRQAVSELNGAGYEAGMRVPLAYKRTLCEEKIASRADSTLCFTKEYGTRFVVGAIATGFPLSERLSRRGGGECLHCGACRAACPTGALVEGGFIRERCLRQHMEDGRIAEVSDKLGTLLLGCGVCQRVCPLNAGIPPLPVPEEVASLTRLDALWAALTGGDRRPLAAAVGSNYARSGKLLGLVANAMGNSGNPNYLPLLRGRTEPEALEAIRKLSGRGEKRNPWI